MAEMLTYYAGRSTAIVMEGAWHFARAEPALVGVGIIKTSADYDFSLFFINADESSTEFADENYAREIMQLFTTGTFRRSNLQTLIKSVTSNA